VDVSIDAALPRFKIADSPVGPVHVTRLAWRGPTLRVEGTVRTPITSVAWTLDGTVTTTDDTIVVDALRLTGAGPLNDKVRAALGGRDVTAAGWRIRTAPDGSRIVVTVPR